MRKHTANSYTSISIIDDHNYYTKLNCLTKICVSQKYHTCGIKILMQVIIVLIDNMFCGEKVLWMDEVHSRRASNLLENFCNSLNFMCLCSARNNSGSLAIFQTISALGRLKSILVSQISCTFSVGQQSITYEISYLQKMADQFLILISSF